MNGKKIIMAGVVMAVASALALDYVEVIDVKARQRYPWNGLVDIDYELDSKATEPYQMKVTVFDNDGKTNLPVKTVYTEGVSFSQNPTMVKSDTSRIIWDASADLPNGFKCTNVLVTCQDERTIDNPKRYMIIDLSVGANATSYPVTYMNCPPSGGWTEEYMKTKLVLRRVEPGSFLMGSSVHEDGHQNNETQHKVTLSKAFYIGVFELTASQYALIKGGAGSDTQPVAIDYYTIRGYDVDSFATGSIKLSMYSRQYGTTFAPCYKGEYSVDFGKKELYSWPTSNAVDENSLMGRLRARTALNFDLPTEAQWEYACRAGSVTPLNIGTDASTANVQQVSGPAKVDESYTTGIKYIYVGNYLPNALGLYDMLGNLGEWCLDCYKDDLGDADASDPTGETFSNALVTYTDSFSKLVEGSGYNFESCSISVSADGQTWMKSFNAPDTNASIPDDINVFCSYKSYCTKRVVKGTGSRSSLRTFANSSHNITSDWFTKNVNITGRLYNASYYDPYSFSLTKKFAGKTNPKYGVRLVVTVDD